MSSMKVWCVVVALAIGPAVAWAQDVHTSSSPLVNFSLFKTYYWAKTNALPGNDIINQHIMAAVDQGMAQHGWTKAPKGQADLAVVANVSTQQQSNWRRSTGAAGAAGDGAAGDRRQPPCAAISRERWSLTSSMPRRTRWSGEAWQPTRSHASRRRMQNTSTRRSKRCSATSLRKANTERTITGARLAPAIVVITLPLLA